MRRGLFVSRLIACMILLLPCSAIAARQLEIGYALHDPQGLHGRFSEQLFFSAGQAVGELGHDTAFLSSMDSRVEEDARLDSLRSLHGSLDANDGLVDESTDLPDPERPSMPIPTAWQAIEPLPAVASAIASEDRLVADYLIDRYGLDILLVLATERLDAFIRVRMLAYERAGIGCITFFDAIALPADLPDLRDEALLSLLGYLQGNPLGMVVLESGPPGLHVSLGGIPVRMLGTTVLLPPGSYVLALDAPGYLPAEVAVELGPNEILRKPITMTAHLGGPLLVSSAFHAATVLFSSGLSGTLPLVSDAQALPFALQASVEGMKVIRYQESEERKELRLEFDVPWMDAANQVSRAQDELYASLGRTLLMGALTIVIESLSQSVSALPEDRVWWQPFVLASGAGVAVSGVDTCLRLFAYYQKTKYSSQ